MVVLDVVRCDLARYGTVQHVAVLSVWFVFQHRAGLRQNKTYEHKQKAHTHAHTHNHHDGGGDDDGAPDRREQKKEKAPGGEKNTASCS